MKDDESQPIVELILTTYTFEGFLYSTLNQSQRDGDLSKVHTIGPYSLALNLILKEGKRKQEDEDRFEKGVVLYRGTALTEEEI